MSNLKLEFFLVGVQKKPALDMSKFVMTPVSCSCSCAINETCNLSILLYENTSTYLQYKNHTKYALDKTLACLRPFSGLGQGTVMVYTILKSFTHDVFRFFGRFYFVNHVSQTKQKNTFEAAVVLWSLGHMTNFFGV